MGDQSKLVLLKEVIKVIKEENLLQRVNETGRMLLSGLEKLQVMFLTARFLPAECSLSETNIPFSFLIPGVN